MSDRLTDNEVTVLAYHLARRQIAESEYWLEWEDIPMVGQYDFDRLVAKVSTVTNYLAEAQLLMEKSWGVDGQELLERLTEGENQ